MLRTGLKGEIAIAAARTPNKESHIRLCVSFAAGNREKQSLRKLGKASFISEDSALATLQRRAAQVGKLREAKKAGKIAYFVLDRLVIRNKKIPPNQDVSFSFFLLLFDGLNEFPIFHLDNEGFRSAIFDQSIGRINFDYDRLSSLKFNPLLSEREYDFSICND